MKTCQLCFGGDTQALNWFFASASTTANYLEEFLLVRWLARQKVDTRLRKDENKNRLVNDANNYKASIVLHLQAGRQAGRQKDENQQSRQRQQHFNCPGGEKRTLNGIYKWWKIAHFQIGLKTIMMTQREREKRRRRRHRFNWQCVRQLRVLVVVFAAVVVLVAATFPGDCSFFLSMHPHYNDTLPALVNHLLFSLSLQHFLFFPL